MPAPQKSLILVLGTACLGLGIYAYGERMARLAAEQRLLTAQAESVRLAAMVDEPSLIPPTASLPPSSVLPDPSESIPEPSQPVAAERREPTRPRPGGPEIVAAMESPEMQQLMNLRARGALDSRYAQLFKQLGLSPAQLQRFQQLLIDKQNTTRDVMAAMRSQGLAPGRSNGDQTRALIQNANAEIDAQIQSEFGANIFAQYQSYEQTQPQRSLVERVQQRLSYSGTALTDQQAASLVSMLAQSAPASSGRPRGQGPGGVAISDEVVTQAQAILFPSQVGALRELQREQQAQSELLRRARQNFGGGR